MYIDVIRVVLRDRTVDMRKKYVGFMICIDASTGEKIVLRKTDEPFEWFPSLLGIFMTLGIKHMQFEFDEYQYVIKEVID